ncbi:MAG TPA: carbonic anhydrase [Candidatus Methylomirabilis sp.]|nr:carbonic anhydrase [Candidatus Methylomirabilis sp.]
MDEIKKLIDGFHRFRTRHYERDGTPFKQLVREGQAPKIMVIACCDSRVDPAIITDCDPGDLFVVRNVANLVPPYETTGHYHGTSAALEFAVRFLGVRHLVVLGHARCGGIRALLQGVDGGDDRSQFIQPWMEIATEARRKATGGRTRLVSAEVERACEQAAIEVSLNNLLTFPWIRRRIESGQMWLHGWYFDMDRGELLRYDAADGRFDSLSAATPAPLA